MGVGGKCHAAATLPPRKRPGTHLQEAGWAPGPVWMGADNLASTGIRSSDLPAHSELLYWLSYPSSPSISYRLIYFNKDVFIVLRCHHYHSQQSKTRNECMNTHCNDFLYNTCSSLPFFWTHLNCLHSSEKPRPHLIRSNEMLLLCSFPHSIHNLPISTVMRPSLMLYQHLC